jgi:heme oxygenase (biliverdin-IX-beta and delta-forming)
MGDELKMLARLNNETRAFHAGADADIDEFLLQDPITAAGYLTYMSRLYGFLIPFEEALAQTRGLDEMIDTRERVKSPLVLRDLAGLGLSSSEISMLPRCESVPGFRGAAQALGWMYVVERPLLASGVIKSHLNTTLVAEMACASSYLSCYAGHVGSAWRELGEVMDEMAKTPVIADRIVSSAKEAFRCLRRWRDVELVSTIPYAI